MASSSGGHSSSADWSSAIKARLCQTYHPDYILEGPPDLILPDLPGQSPDQILAGSQGQPAADQT